MDAIIEHDNNIKELELKIKQQHFIIQDNNFQMELNEFKIKKFMDMIADHRSNCKCRKEI